MARPRRETIPDLPASARPKIDKSVLTISEPKRIRCKEHLRFVASQPCVICGRLPSHAHHVRYAQSRGLSLKVSDEFTVPLCAIHHDNIHTTGKEQEWWHERNIDPLKVANALWRHSRERYPVPRDKATYREFWRIKLISARALLKQATTQPRHTRSHRRRQPQAIGDGALLEHATGTVSFFQAMAPSSLPTY